MVFLICFIMLLAAFISAHFLFLKSVVENITQLRVCRSRCRDPTVHNPFIYPLYRALGLVIFIRRKKKTRTKISHATSRDAPPSSTMPFSRTQVLLRSPTDPKIHASETFLRRMEITFIGINTYHHPVRCCIPRPRDLTRSTEMTKRRLNI